MTRSPMMATVSKVLSSLFVLSLLGAGWLAVHHMDTEGADHAEESTADVEAPIADRVTLTEGKLASAGLAFGLAEPHAIQHIHEVPGRIGYDQSHHIEVRSPIDGVLAKVLVKTGEVVDVGQTIAKISSPEIGQARAELMRQDSQEKLVAARYDRAKDVAANVRQFASMLEDRIDAAELETAFENRTIGDYRQTLQPAYVKYRLASELLENVRPLTGTGALSGRTIRERDAEYQVAMAEYQAARDQAIFDSTQAEREAHAELDNARRQTEIAREQLNAMLGGAKYVSSAEDDLSTLDIRSPIAGTVESRKFAENERVYRADGLFVIANTDKLYVSADIREQDWPAVSIEPGAEILVSVPALPDTQMTARVHYVGREVHADTNAVPLVAVIANQNGVLRPGMFARVSLPVGKPKTVLAVRPEAIFQHDNRDFVFVAVSDSEFQPTPVVCGDLRSEDWVEVQSGLTAGQRVVEKGVFVLKSEWLLEGEGE
ncbi:efflux RND transporter periplasmic adaptor subunit [Blastopirellula sp. JC733]|nr:efflux RND transporter periplasmic adaptor subunit [Blastopirellula sediminis]